MKKFLKTRKIFSNPEIFIIPNHFFQVGKRAGALSADFNLEDPISSVQAKRRKMTMKLRRQTERLIKATRKAKGDSRTAQNYFQPFFKFQLAQFVRRVDPVRAATNREKSEKTEKGENNEEKTRNRDFLESANSKISSSF